MMKGLGFGGLEMWNWEHGKVKRKSHEETSEGEIWLYSEALKILWYPSESQRVDFYSRLHLFKVNVNY